MTADKLPFTPRSAVVSVVVRVSGPVPIRLDATHLGAPEQQLGLSLGTVLIYLRSGTTARAVAEGWTSAAPLARRLAPPRDPRNLMPVTPTMVGTLVRLAGIPTIVAAHVPARAHIEPSHLRLQIGPVIWQICDWAAYESMARGWRRAAATLGSKDD